MTGWRSWVPRWRRNEKGVSEAATAMFVLPLLALLIFSLIETGFNLRYRMMVDSQVQDAVRATALDGGNCNPRTSGCTNASVQGHAAKALANLKVLCNGTARCTQPPTMVCTPPVAANAGDPVSCTATFYYRPTTGLATNPATSLGFSLLFTKPITITMVSQSGVGK